MTDVFEKLNPEEKYLIFGEGGGQLLADEFHTNLLGQIPLVAEIGKAADNGKSVFSQESLSVADTFMSVSGKLLSILNM